jgi:hypothetical protein
LNPPQVKDLKIRVESHGNGVKTAFDSLREQIVQIKAGFWEKHGDQLKAVAQERIQQKIRERVPVEASRLAVIIARIPIKFVCRSKDS